MNQIVQKQAETAGCRGDDVKFLVRRSMNSLSWLDFRRRHRIKRLKYATKMTKGQLDDFMASTVNGKSSRRILEDCGTTVSEAWVLRGNSVVLKTTRADE